MALSRRTALTLSLLLLPRPGRAEGAPPPFPEWVGRTAKLSTAAGSARLLLGRDGTGLLSVSVLYLCRPVALRSWTMAPDGLSVRYSRVAVLDPNRMVQGEARIEGETLHWIEAQAREAQFEGFGPPEAARSCS